MAALAGIGLHEKLARNFLASVNFGRAGKEVSPRTVTLLVHRFGSIRRVLNARRVQPARVAHVPGSRRKQREHQETNCVPKRCTTGIWREPARAADPIRTEDRASRER